MNSSTIKLIKITAIIIALVATVTNPGSDKYQLYASEKLSNYLQEDGCSKITEELNNPCRLLVTTARPQIKLAIEQSTEYKNFFLFSLYYTRLSISPLTPSYDFATLGFLNRFITYQAEINN